MEIVVRRNTAESEWEECTIIVVNSDTVRGEEGGEGGFDDLGEECVE